MNEVDIVIDFFQKNEDGNGKYLNDMANVPHLQGVAHLLYMRFFRLFCVSILIDDDGSG